MNSNIIKPEKFNHIHLVYHFKILLRRHPSGKNIRKIEISQFLSVAHFWLDAPLDIDDQRILDSD